ncbi:MAG: Nif3-like dinuclear metal center hexameric protein [Bacteroidales bacterium]
MKIKDITDALETFAPLQYQESYDNAGLIVGNSNAEIESVLLSLDVTEEVIEEAVQLGAGLIVAHHPIIFKGLKKLTGRNYVERSVIRAIKSDVAIYAAHTNMDAVANGVNRILADKIGLENIAVMNPRRGLLKKIHVFVPSEHADAVREAAFTAGAGQIGEYDNCSYNTEGKGSFRAGEGSNPYVGRKGETHFEEEIRIEMVFPDHMQAAVLNAVLKAHPYEEVAYDIYTLDNAWNQVGIGLVGELKNPWNPMDFMTSLKKILGQAHLRYTRPVGNEIRRVAVCGGSGSFAIQQAKAAGADLILTADVKYHEFFDADDQIMIVDAGHYETEQFTKELFSDVIQKNFPNFAVRFSNVNTNPVNYF